MRRALVLFTFLFAALATPTFAHPGLHHEIERLTKLIQKDPTRTDLLLARAQTYRLDKQYAKAIEDLDRAATLNADASQLALERGLSLSGLGRDDAAVLELTKHLAGSRPMANGYAERAAIRERRRQAAEAIDDWTAAIALVPKVDWYLARGRLQESLDRIDDAANGFREGLSRCTGAVPIRLELLRLEASRGNYEAAISLIDDVLPRAAVKTDWYLRRADVQTAAGKFDAACEDRRIALDEADRAVARRPTAQRLITRAKVLIALDNSTKAAADLKAALQKSPSLAEAEQLLRQIERKDDSSPFSASAPMP